VNAENLHIRGTPPGMLFQREPASKSYTFIDGAEPGAPSTMANRWQNSTTTATTVLLCEN
jgi:hypothetical protein